MIFLAGVSASGKTHAAALLASTSEYIHVKASEMLENMGRPIRSLTKSDAMQNQKMLLEAVKDRVSRNENVIFDGHATIETKEGQIQVPDWFFDNIKLEKIICIIDDPVKIAARRLERGERIALVDIESAQNYEVLCARRQAERLAIQYREATGQDGSTFHSAVFED